MSQSGHGGTPLTNLLLELSQSEEVTRLREKVATLIEQQGLVGSDVERLVNERDIEGIRKALNAEQHATGQPVAQIFLILF